MGVVTKIQENCDRSYSDSGNWAALTDELYRFVLPYRQPSGRSGTGTKKSKFSGIFDSTAPKAAVRFAGRMESDVTPPFQRFFHLKVGPGHPAFQKPDEKKTLDELLEGVSELIQAVIDGAEFSLASQEMYLDLFGGQGAMLMLEDEDQIIKFVAVPAGEIALREDGYGRVIGVYWRKSFKGHALEGMWPNMTLSDEQKKKIRDNENIDVVIVQACEFDRGAKRWTFTVFEDKDEKQHVIHEQKEMRTSPWLTPRFFKVPGEAHGRGPGLMALPTVKTLNKVTELSLKAAAFAVLGLWTVRNDRVFNPKTSRMFPGAMWKVASNGGALGSSIQKLDVPGRFDISNLVINDLRDAVKQATFDDTLPPSSGAVRSPTEIVERIKRLTSDLSSAYARLVLEIIRPLVQRIIDVLHRRGLIGELNIDQLLFQVKVISPISRGQHIQDVSAIVQWMEIMLSTVGQEGLLLTAKVEEIFADIGRKLGVDEKHIRPKDERDGLLKIVAQLIAQSQQEAQQPAGAEQVAVQAGA